MHAALNSAAFKCTCSGPARHRERQSVVGGVAEEVDRVGHHRHRLRCHDATSFTQNMPKLTATAIHSAIHSAGRQRGSTAGVVGSGAAMFGHAGRSRF